MEYVKLNSLKINPLFEECMPMFPHEEDFLELKKSIEEFIRREIRKYCSKCNKQENNNKRSDLKVIE